MKRNKKLKKLLLILVSGILVAAIGAGIWYATTTNVEPVNVFSFNYIGMTEYWGDSQESYGFVQTDKIQTVFLSATQNVTDILVSEGDTVSKGDVLMTFDTTLSDLALERKRLDVEKLKLQLEDAQAELKRIRNMKPMVIPAPSEDEEETNKGIELTDPYKISTLSEYDGSKASKAMICWLNTGTSINNELLEELLKQADIYQNENARKEAEKETNSGSAPDGESSAEDPTEPERINVFRYYVVFKITSGNMSLGNRTTWQGMMVTKRTNGSFKMKFFDASSVPDHMLADNEKAPETPQIDYGSGYTSSQIAEMRSQQEKTIKDLEFQIKMADAEYKIMQTEVNDGNVYADVDGTVVSVLSAEEADMTGQPIIKVSGGGGFFVEGSISELDRDTVTVGSEVSVNDWQTGMVYTGTIQSIGDYPSSDSYWSGIGNPTATYYPFTVFVEESADLQSGRYVSIIYSAGSSENGIYLENPFLRTEAGQSYVYVLGDGGTLEKRFVTTGKSLWGSYTQILEGITPEDFLAFPYGTDVKPGAPAVEADLSALYE